MRGYARTHTDPDSRHSYSHGRTDIYSDTSAAYRNTDPYADTYAASDQHPNSHADVRAHTDYSADGRGLIRDADAYKRVPGGPGPTTERDNL